jgi:hypothetical protein
MHAKGSLISIHENNSLSLAPYSRYTPENLFTTNANALDERRSVVEEAIERCEKRQN